MPAYVAAQIAGAFAGVGVAHYMFGVAFSASMHVRSITNTFAGIRPMDAPGFIAGQLAGAFAATLLFRWLTPTLKREAPDVLMEH